MAALLSISIAPTYSAPLVSLDEVELIKGQGLAGDRHVGSVRQVTIVCTGELQAASEIYGSELDPFETRRNLVVDLAELPRTHGARIAIGEAEIEVWRDCAPCAVMDEVFGDGAKEALGRRAGVSAQVVTGGTIRIGDRVEVITPG